MKPQSVSQSEKFRHSHGYSQEELQRDLQRSLLRSSLLCREGLPTCKIPRNWCSKSAGPEARQQTVDPLRITLSDVSIISDLHWLDWRCMRDWGTSNQGSVRSKSNGNTRCWRGIDKFCLGKNNCSIWLDAGYQHIGKQGNTELMFFLTKIKDSCLSFQRRKIRGKMQRTESETLRGAEMCFTFETMKLKIERLKKEKSLRRSFTILQRQRLLSWA